jgi:PIN domain nuclease of toxin-antitoxin system
MKLLLDTHAFLWFIGGDKRLSPSARVLIEDVSNDAYLSIASLWEMAIKISLGRLQLAQPFETFIPHQLSLNRIGLLGITMSHTARWLLYRFIIVTRLIVCWLHKCKSSKCHW